MKILPKSKIPHVGMRYRHISYDKTFYMSWKIIGEGFIKNDPIWKLTRIEGKYEEEGFDYKKELEKRIKTGKTIVL